MKKKRRKQIKRCVNEQRITEESSGLVITNKNASSSADDPDQQHLQLPDEVFSEHILTRLPVKTLKDLSFVSKLWYNSIYKDPQFVSSHFQRSKENPFLIFRLLNSYDGFTNIRHLMFSIDVSGDNDSGGHYDYNTVLANNVDIQDYTNTNNLVFHETSCFTTLREIVLVNCCNGFGCFTQSSSRRVNFMIQNPSWGLEILSTTCPYIDNYIKFCYGFGFDSLTNEYKVVTVLCNYGGGDSEDQLFKCMVYTQGTCSWRETNSSPLVAGCSPSGIRRMSRMSFSKSAIFVSGFLYWRIFVRGVYSGNEKEMLLLFDLHDENYKLVRIPAECSSTTTAERMQVVDQLLVIKESPCVVVFEKLLLTNGHHVNHTQQQAAADE